MRLSDYNNVYTSSSSFPDPAREWIPAELWTAIDGGNEAFFREIAPAQPLTYRVLVDRCTPVALVEAASRGMGLNNLGKVQLHYQWGLMCGERLVIGTIPVVRSMRGFAAEQLACLPAALHGWYSKANGFTIPGPQGPGLVDYDLPANISGWRELDYYCGKQKVRKQRLQRINKELPGHDLRIVLYGSQGDLVLTDMARKDGRLYHVHDHHFEDYAPLDNADAVLDRYFANALLGFPEPVDFRSP